MHYLKNHLTSNINSEMEQSRPTHKQGACLDTQTIVTTCKVLQTEHKANQDVYDKHHLGPGSASVASNTTVNYSDERDKVYIVYYSTFVCHRFCADEHKFSCVSRTISFNQSYMYCTCMHTQNTFRNTCSTYCTCTCCCEVTQCHL